MQIGGCTPPTARIAEGTARIPLPAINPDANIELNIEQLSVPIFLVYPPLAQYNKST
jgi:hypothetical protein